jgi:hypothetical protein
MTFRFIYVLASKTLHRPEERMATSGDQQPLDEAHHVPHPRPKVDESSRTLTRPVQYACMQYTVVTLLLHAHAVNRNQ